jgi:hypothetical protein
MPSAKPEKARIINLDDSSEQPIECLFNPNEYTFSKRNTWSKAEIRGKNVPQLEFGGGDSMTLTMQLFFDTYTTGKDVRDTTNRIWKLMNINEKLTNVPGGPARPPMVEFRWGKTWSFKAVITSISQRFTLFRYDGTPVRATLDVTFMQAKEGGRYPGQNPTTVGVPGYKRRVVKEGENIDWIAHEEYGDSSKWRFIATTNSLDDPQRLKPGWVLVIAPLP